MRCPLLVRTHPCCCRGLTLLLQCRVYVKCVWGAAWVFTEWKITDLGKTVMTFSAPSRCLSDPSGVLCLSVCAEIVPAGRGCQWHVATRASPEERHFPGIGQRYQRRARCHGAGEPAGRRGGAGMWSDSHVLFPGGFSPEIKPSPAYLSLNDFTFPLFFVFLAKVAGCFSVKMNFFSVVCIHL